MFHSYLPVFGKSKLVWSSWAVHMFARKLLHSCRIQLFYTTEPNIWEKPYAYLCSYLILSTLVRKLFFKNGFGGHFGFWPLAQYACIFSRSQVSHFSFKTSLEVKTIVKLCNISQRMVTGLGGGLNYKGDITKGGTCI